MLDREATAVAVIDMQNDFCDPAGYYGRKGLDIASVRAGIPSLGRLLAAARAGGVPVLYTRIVHDPAVADVMSRHRVLPPGWVAGEPRLGPGTWGAEIIPELAPRPGDPVFDKSDYSAFYGTALEPYLRRRGIRTLVLAGTVDYACVLHTAFDAFCRDLDVLLCREAVSGWQPELSAPALRIVELLLGRVVSEAELLGELAV